MRVSLSPIRIASRDAPQADCPQCRSTSPLLFSVGDLNQKVQAQEFDYYQCRDCGLIFLSPIPGDLGVFYQPSYYAIPGSVEDLKSGTEPEFYKLEAIKSFASGRRLLEIGPSYGRFALLAKSAGFEVHAFEMDRACCAFLNDVVGISALHTTDVIESMRKSGPHEVIAMWHSLEHLPDPWTLLDLVHDRLSPGGILAIATPNPGSFQFRIFKQSWVHVDAPRHVELIPPEVLTQRLSSRGLKRVHFTTSDRGARDCDALGWQVWLQSLSHRYPESSFGKYVEFVGLQLTRIARCVEMLPGLGSAYTAVFRKT